MDLTKLSTQEAEFLGASIALSRATLSLKAVEEKNEALLQVISRILKAHPELKQEFPDVFGEQPQDDPIDPGTVVQAFDPAPATLRPVPNEPQASVAGRKTGRPAAEQQAKEGVAENERSQ